uniref:hypothetical protein n=1 Tax=Candidatus Frankia alpina TaxID=2699483 RepID=UPI00196853C8
TNTTLMSRKATKRYRERLSVRRMSVRVLDIHNRMRLIAITKRSWTFGRRSSMLIPMTQATTVLLTCCRWLDLARGQAALCR